MNGRGAWVWYVDHCGGPDGIVQTARAARLTHLMVKGGDGADPWPQLSPDLVARLHDAGLQVYGWQYCYGASPGEEAAVAARILDAGVDGFVADVEAEYEGRWPAAQEYARAVRSHAGDRLFAYSPLPVVDLHLSLPYVQLNASCDLVLPQLYSRALGAKAWPLDGLYALWARWRATWSAWGVAAPPIAPVGETFGEATADDVRAFEAAARRERVPAWSYWALDHMRPEHVAALQAPPGPTQGLAGDPAVVAALDGIWARTERLASIGHEADAVDIQKHVADLKSALGATP